MYPIIQKRDEVIEAVPMIELWQNVTFLTDVTALYIFEIGDKRYFFFGDQHESKSAGGCQQRCDDFELNFKDEKYYGSSCTSIGVLLHNWFTYNNDHNIKTDFYLELQFTTEDDRDFNRAVAKIINDLKAGKKYPPNVLDTVSWMSLIASLNQPCFVKEKVTCQYHPNVHLHYADIRGLDTGYVALNTDPFLLFDIEKYVNNFTFTRKEEIIELKDQLSIILSILTYDYMDIVNGILNPIGFQDFLNKYNNLSEGFSQSLGRNYLLKIRNMERLSVIRNGVKMHRAAGELLRLRQQTPYMADLIEVFIYMKYDEYFAGIQSRFETNMIDFDRLDDVLSRPYVTNNEANLILTRLKNIFQEFVYALVPVSALSMDAYLLARMFLQLDSKEIMTYTGYAHTKNYVEFFEKFLGAQSLVSAPPIKNNRCLNIPDLPKYLDVNKYRTYMVKKTYNIQ